MAYKYLELIGYEPCFLNSTHKKQSESCMESLIKMRRQYISPEDARRQVQRNEAMLQTDARYKSMR